MKKEILPLEQNVLDTVRMYRMCKKGEKLLVAVSGGVDSMVLLRSLFYLRKKIGITLQVVHFNHQLRGAKAKRDEEFVRWVAKRMNMKVTVGTRNVRRYARHHKRSLEEAARLCRYDYFVKTAKKYGIQKLALGHTQDDQAETVLMRVIKGTGIKGLAAIRPVLQYGNATVIRPLIMSNRNEILQYAKQEQIRFREDATNRSVKFLRNKMRHRLIPLFEKEFNPQIKKALARLASSAAVDIEFLRKEAHISFKKIVRKKKKGEVVLRKKKFLAVHPALGFRIFDEALQVCSPEATLDFEHWSMLRNAIKEKKKANLCLSDKITVFIEYDDIVIRRLTRQKRQLCVPLPIAKTVTIPEAGMSFKAVRVEKRNVKIQKKKTVEYFDLKRLSLPLSIRTRREGDRFKPLGMKGSKKLKDLLMEKKIPRYKRDLVPLITSNDDIIWVVPFSISDSYKITSATKQVLKITVDFV
ncbi:MAG: tRNA lysidine(34) synthetase TilS [Candidatus Omnitrophica bacterium]|nr:tRNA lysidine(34) synthetase TilS [Candidatus Omnitrophota bacterium]